MNSIRNRNPLCLKQFQLMQNHPMNFLHTLLRTLLCSLLINLQRDLLIPLFDHVTRFSYFNCCFHFISGQNPKLDICFDEQLDGFANFILEFIFYCGNTDEFKVLFPLVIDFFKFRVFFK